VSYSVTSAPPASLAYRRVVLDAEAVATGANPERGWHPDATWRLIQLLTGVGLGLQAPNPSLRQTHRE
jgi:hypothetical protein